MKRQILILIAVWAVALSGLVLYLNWRYQHVQVANNESASYTSSQLPLPVTPLKYKCNGKRICSEMDSCEEATFYLQNCPGTIMDGDNDDIPCENRLCDENGKSSYSSSVVYSQGRSGNEKGFSYSYGKVESHTDSSSSSDSRPVTEASSQYQCLGKTRCTEMTSCAEAMFYLQNCPGTKMDGDNDGIPCEGQWCGH
jgi:hypothetical protein